MDTFHIHEYKQNVLYIRYLHTTGTAHSSEIEQTTTTWITYKTEWKKEGTRDSTPRVSSSKKGKAGVHSGHLGSCARRGGSWLLQGYTYGPGGDSMNIHLIIVIYFCAHFSMFVTFHRKTEKNAGINPVVFNQCVCVLMCGKTVSEGSQESAGICRLGDWNRKKIYIPLLILPY